MKASEFCRYRQGEASEHRQAFGEMMFKACRQHSHEIGIEDVEFVTLNDLGRRVVRADHGGGQNVSRCCNPTTFQ